GQAAGPGVLHHHRLAAGQVADGAVTGPAVHELDAVGLDAAEFAARRLDVGAILLGRGADVPCLAHAPAHRAEALAPFGVLLAQAHGQLEPRGRAGRELGVLEVGDPLLVRERRAREIDRPAPP